MASGLGPALTGRRRDALLAGLAAALVVIAFLPALRAGFVWDDGANLIDNHAYRHFDWRHLKWMFQTVYMGPYQPLAWLSLGVDFKLWGLNPRGFHLTNVLLHALNAGLVFFLGRELLRRALPETGERELEAGALFSALVFGLHPLRVESVAWITERRDVLAGAFALAATLAYLRGRLRRAFALYAGCLLSKASGVMLPAAWLALDLFPSRRLGWRAAREKLPFFILAGLAAVAAVLGQWQVGNLRSLDELGWAQRLAQSALGLGFYLEKTLWPARLSPLYAPPARLGLALPAVWLHFALVPAAALTLKTLRVCARAQAALWAWYVLMLLPVLGLLQNGPQLAADRYTYLACLGWAALAGAALAKAVANRPRAALAAAAAVVVALAALTWRRALVWRDDDALWASALEADPGSIPARLNYGLALAGKRRLFEALSVYQEAEALAPDNAMVLAHHGWALLELKRYAEARGVLEEAVRLSPDLAPARTYLGACLMGLGEPAAAQEQFERALELQPSSDQAVPNLLAARQAAEQLKKTKRTR